MKYLYHCQYTTNMPAARIHNAPHEVFVFRKKDIPKVGQVTELLHRSNLKVTRYKRAQ